MRSRKGFLVAGIIAATGALICCAGPLVVLAIGAGGTWFGASSMLEHYPVLVGLLLPLLAVGLYKLRRVCASGCDGPPGLKRRRLAIWAAVSLVLSLTAIWFWLSRQC
jgi:mercuric ion transport protein